MNNNKKTAVAKDIIAQVLSGAMRPVSGYYVTKNNLPDIAATCEVCAVGAAILQEHINDAKKRHIAPKTFIRGLDTGDLLEMTEESINAMRADKSKYFTAQELETLEDLYENVTGGKRDFSRELRSALGLEYDDELEEDLPFTMRYNAATLLALYGLLAHYKGDVSKMAEHISAGKADYSKIMPAILEVAASRNINVEEGTAVCAGLKTLKEAIEIEYRTRRHTNRLK